MDKAPKQPRTHRFHISRWQIIGIIVLVLALGSTITASMATIDQRRIAECQAGFNKAYRLALIERANAANKERESVRTLWGALLNPGATNDDRRAAATKYYEALAQGDQARDRHPLPESDSCR